MQDARETQRGGRVGVRRLGDPEEREGGCGEQGRTREENRWM